MPHLMPAADQMAAGERRPLRRFLAALVLIEIFSGVLQAYFTPVYADLAVKFHVSIGTLSWALTGFTLSTAIFTPMFAKMGDLYGHRRVLRIQLAVVTAGSLLIAAAPAFPVLLAGRVMQGTFAAYLPLMFGLVRSRYSRDDTRRAISYLTSFLIFGFVFGLAATGFIVRYADSATWALWLPAAGNVLALAGLLIARGESVRPPARRPRFDWPGALLLGAGFALVLLGLSEGPTWGWTSARVLGCLVAGGVLLVVWTQVELRVADPLADLRFVIKRAFLPVYTAGFCINFAVLGGQVVLGTFMAAPRALLGYGLGLPAFSRSLYLALIFIPMFIAVFSTARLARAIGYRVVMAAGCVFAAAGLTCVVAWHNNLAAFVALMAVVTIGAGLIESSTRTLVVDGLRDTDIAVGEGIYELSITTGAAVGSAVLGGVLSAHAAKIPGLATQQGYEAAWIVSAAVCGVAAVVSIAHAAAHARTPGGRPVPDQAGLPGTPLPASDPSRQTALRRTSR